MLWSDAWTTPQRRPRRGWSSLPNVLDVRGASLAVPAVVAVPVLLTPAHWAALVGAGDLYRRLPSPTGSTVIWPAPGRQQSTLGRMLDPIADKLLVGATPADADALTTPSTAGRSGRRSIILCREILVSGLREFLAELNVKVHVTQLAKWKTTVQMVALGVLLAGPAGDKVIPGLTTRPGCHAGSRRC